MIDTCDCLTSLPPFKRGDTFSVAGPGRLPSGTWSATSQVRSKLTGDLVADLVVTLAPITDVSDNHYTHAISLEKAAAATALWPLGQLECDVQFIDAGGVVRSTQTFVIQVVKDITHP